MTVTMINLKSNMCKWPIGDPRSSKFHFCGERGEAGISYCKKHTGLAYRADSNKRTVETKSKAA